MDLATPAPPPPSRVAHLWEVTAAGAAQRESSAVTSNSFSFNGPLPTQLSISVATTGEPDIVGPDFRSSPMAAAGVTAPVRVELVVCPEIRLDAAELSQLVSSTFTPVTQHVSLIGGILSADISVLTADATVTSAGVVVKLTGQVVVQGAGGGTFAFSGSVTLNLVPLAAPGTSDLLDILTVSGPVFEVLGGAAGVLSSLVSVMRGTLGPLFADQVRNAARKQLPAVLVKSFVLPVLPDGVTVSLRKLQIDATGISFQPVLGAIGTVLSTFHPPAIAGP